MVAREGIFMENMPISEGARDSFRSVGILGLGLIGGSLARAIRSRTDVARIVAADVDGKALELAREDNVIDDFAVITPDNISQGLHIFNGIDVLFLCTPLDVMTQMKPVLQTLDIGVITDVGSVKAPVMDAMTLRNFIGGHPMAGSERRGYTCGRASLFEQALYVLCVPNGCMLAAWQLCAMEKLITDIGAIPMRMTAIEHDERVAAVSHLPHVVASALSLFMANEDDGALARMAAGGFKDITRIASSDSALWAGITNASRDALLPIIDRYIEVITKWKAALVAEDEKELERLYSMGACYRNHLMDGTRGALESAASVTVYLADRPGELGAITTLLGEHDMNITNINIRHFRAYEGGQLQLLLRTSAEAVEACALLREAGYECD
ncbi:MAG TPA: prephenate dehydrogenase/arogenate dehydrogenase family protein, partial [Bacillota bacterium]|nr:prephenate dehydrogenase/arogenate dehydrogenase family protein [Bacillota bacterium]